MSVKATYLSELLDPLTGQADDDQAVKDYKDIRNESEFRGIIRKILLPYFQLRDAVCREKIKISLSYYLEYGGIDYGRILDAELLPFITPEPPRNFFLWIWEEFFPSEDYTCYYDKIVRSECDLEE